jgi:hypothetical protein
MIRISALKVNQWLADWDSFTYNPASYQRKPEPYFYVASMPAAILRRLAGFRRRQAKGPRAADIGIQRAHDEQRSDEIARFIRAGYPWAKLNTRDQKRFPDLRKPGWLPTAIIANLVTDHTRRQNLSPDTRDLVTIERIADNRFALLLPDGADKPDWAPRGSLAPIEIIDGQHRLLAVREDEPEDYQLPVVLFDDLDISWQAYLFWTINISPKRISPSFAYDLFPLLRTEDWLEKTEGPRTYRETRAQELTEVLWSHPASPWHNRISMLGRERGKVTQAAWIRSLTVSFVRQWDITRKGTGGLFGAEVVEDGARRVFLWSRPQQAAYLIQLWSDLADAIARTEEPWILDLRRRAEYAVGSVEPDPAFDSVYSLLATEQGVRGVLQVTNDMSFALARDLSLTDWRRERVKDPIDLAEVTEALADLRKHKTIAGFSKRIGRQIAKFDWRSAATPELPEEIRNRQSLFRAGTGYREVRRQLLRFLASCDDAQIASAAQSVMAELGYT